MNPHEAPMKNLFVSALFPLALAASAHDGHGLPGVSHWHASDTLGLLLVVVLAAGAWLFSRRP
jgi:hypothetical protein